MPINDIKPFAAAGGANVLTQAEYLALAALSTGFSSGKANSKEVNKAIRQATFIASVLAQFICDKSGSDVLDDGNVAGLVTKLLSAINKTSQPLDATLTALAGLVGAANKLPYFNGTDTATLTDLTQVGRDIIGKTDIAAVLTYLGLGSLGSASGRNVGNVNSYDIPDMSYFTLTGKGTDNLIVKGPNGLIIQVFRRTLPNSTIIGIPQTLAVTYPTPFPVNVWGVFCTKRTYAQIVTSCESINSTGFDAVTCLTSGKSPDSNNSQAVFLAFGY